MDKPWKTFYPKNIPYEIEIPSLSLYDLLDCSAERHPNQKAVIDGDQELTYCELKSASDRFAASLYEKGFRKGDRIALMLPNCVEYIISFYAIHRLGGVVVQVNPMYQSSELDYLLRDSEATWFIGHSEQQKKLEKIGISNQLIIIVADRDKQQEDGLYEWIAKGTNRLPDLDINPEKDLALLQYTGGTTGRSKGVMLTHFNITSNVHQDKVYTADPLQLQEAGERLLGLSPLFHVFGMARMNSAIYTASTYITIEKFEIDKVVDLIRKHRPTIFPGVPTMYISLLNHPDLTADDLSCFKYCSCGSAPLPVEIINQFKVKFDVPIFEGFGMSETSPTTHRNPVIGKRKVGSIGLPYPNTDAKIVDMETGTIEMPPGQAGELVVKGPQIMKGYWRKPEETTLALRDGWLYTGDIATMDEDGYFFIVGRKKEMIIASGFNIYPVEVEEVIYQHKGIAEVCVYGVPDSYSGESVKATIVKKKGAQVTEQEIIEWCTGQLAKYKIPRVVEFKDQLPKSTVGKILKRVLVEEEIERRKAMVGGK
ncbi:long-chain fatty acid--CoA ligase [Sporosarcina sp. JAI121]|uniref:long-chain-fatty-acid--CoA ligase n=1 Tax=Sporosarcina sp. JAI121 TaxID=2723064 RepID=UPI0015CB84D1|nr:long-chain fatty acid--CoA ligase [Sporosarcina sp. JAI121]NYF23758.1 long-chain acyl-CoA synthetase [Sporosarcina sp. JAI121]